MKKKVTIVGAGIGGLSVAALMNRAGHDVSILESHNKMGGLATWFYREDKKFLFQVTQNLFPMRMKKSMRRIWGDAFSNCLRPFKETYFYKEKLMKIPYRAEDMGDYFIKNEITTKAKWESFLANMNLPPNQHLSIQEYLSEFLGTQEDIFFYLFAPIKFAKALNLNDPIGPFLQTLGHFFPDGPLILNTTLPQFFKLMRTHLSENGIDLFLNHHVKKIARKNGQIFSINTNKKSFDSDVILWNAPLKSLAEQLDEHDTWHQFQVSEKSSIFQVYFGLNSPLGHPSHIIFLHQSQDFHEGYFFYDSSLLTLIYTRHQTLSTPLLDQANFSNEKINLIQHAKKLAQKIFGPELEIIYEEASTPQTVERYTKHPYGSAFGTGASGPLFLNALTSKHSGVYLIGIS